MKTSVKKRIWILSNFIASIWSCSICQTPAMFPGVEFLRILIWVQKEEGILLSYVHVLPSSETQVQSVRSGEKVGRKFSSMGERALGYRLSSNYFQKFMQMPAPDWAQKLLCIIVPNRRTVSAESFS